MPRGIVLVSQERDLPNAADDARPSQSARGQRARLQRRG
jgi:hypothetical protein